MNIDNIIIGIDIGTTKIVVAVAEKENNAINILNEKIIISLIFDHLLINQPYPKACSIINTK